MNLRLEDIRWEGLLPELDQSPDLSPYAPLHHDRSILVTGAGGSIGSALARAILQFNPHTLILLDSSEQNLYDIDRELARFGSATKIVSVLGSVADESCVSDLFAKYRPLLVYHAAALKHVPLGEKNPFAVVQNNVFGTVVLANAAREQASERLIMISTDKSVNPKSIMGASKRLAELLLYAHSNAGKRMTSIRLGNVLGSEGSVVPLFLDQIAAGVPVTVTDPEIERYFFTMDETVHRVFAAAADCPTEPAVAVPVMGEPVKIIDLARYLIAQAGADGIPIRFTGLRPGDKLREEFIAADEAVVRGPDNGLIWVTSTSMARASLESGMLNLSNAVRDRDLSGLVATLTELLAEYQPSEYLLSQLATAERR